MTIQHKQMKVPDEDHQSGSGVDPDRSSVGTIRIERRGYKSVVYPKGYSTWIDNRPLKNRGCLT